MQVRLFEDQATREGDLVRAANGSLLMDAGLETVFYIALFTDAKATEDELERAGLEQRGYWLDAFEEDPTVNTGSKLWLLGRRTIDATALSDAKRWAEESLARLVADEAVSDLEVTIERLDDHAISIGISAKEPGATSPYRKTWEVYFAV